MSKKFEALEQAERDLKGMKPDFSSGPEEYLSSLPALHLENEILALHQTLDLLLPRNRKIIQFIGICGGEGASTVCREFARTSAMKMGKNVLLIDADRKERSQYGFFHLRPDYDWLSVLLEGSPAERTLQQIGTSNLFLSLMCSGEYPGGKIFNLQNFREFWDRLKERFELILFDTAPLTSCADALAVSKHVDGVILVLEADKTRVPAAESIRDKLRESGANVLGTIFNKRRYHIPEAIYKRL